jgi:lipopolysaccharide/colanic/teichoic acid biosynthesis glycosyltransferase
MNTQIRRQTQIYSPYFSATLCDRESGCYVEEYFHETLSLERKRTERTGRPFTLLLADIAGVTPEREWRETASKMVQVLTAATRSTDIKGWYLYGSVLGVILTECSGIDEELIRRKTYAGLGEKLSSAQAQQVELAFHTFPESALASDSLVDLTLYPDLSKRKQKVSASQVIKRIVDIAGSIGAIMLFFPFFAVIPLWIKLTSKGPILFRQERVGQYGKRFTFLKFRSMYVNNDDAIHRKFVSELIAGKAGKDDSRCGCEPEKKVFKITNDPRVTPVGRFLRKSSLDELPQFFNVLMGQMSLVGPRPPIAYEVEKYDIWHRRRIMELKPGITGLWQVKGRSSTNFDEMVRLDLHYARTWSLWLDIQLLACTPYAMLKGKGAY